MGKKYFVNSQVKSTLPNTFIFSQIKQQVFSLANFNISIHFEPFINKLYPKVLLKELILYSMSNFQTADATYIDAKIQVKDTEYISIASSKKQDLYVSIGHFKKNETVTYYHDSFNHFYMVLNEVLSKLLAQHNGFILHASSVSIGDNGIVFLGPSGRGKSTIMNMLKDEMKSLGDDSVIIRKCENDYYLYQTPFIEKEGWIEKNSDKHFVKKIYFIKQGDTIHSEILTKNETTKRMLQLAPDFMKRHPKMIESLLQFIQESPLTLFEELTVPLDKEKVTSYFKGQKYE